MTQHPGDSLPMRWSRLVLPPALWLALSGTVPVAPSAQALVECSVSREAVFAALAGFPVASAKEQGTAPDQKINRYYVSPDDFSVFGFPARSFSSEDSRQGEIRNVSIMAIVGAPFDQVVAAGLAKRGLSKCEAQSGTARRTCVAVIGNEDGWLKTLVFMDHHGSETGIGCAYTRTRR